MTVSVKASAYLHHLKLYSADPARMARFYADAMDMQARETGADTCVCEGSVRRVMFAPGTPILASPSTLFQGGAFAVRDPDGNAIAFGLAREDPAP